MKTVLLLSSFFFLQLLSFSQDRVLRDDTISVEFSNNTPDLEFEPVPYYNLDGFQQYRPFGSHRSPIARSGNLGLPTHSYFIEGQDWDITHNLGGYQNYLMTKESLRFYNVSRPFTELRYTNGAQSEQLFNVLHSQNLGEGLNIAFEYQRTVSEGFFLRQLTNHTQFNSTYNLTSRNQRFLSRGYYIINNIEAQENGGTVLSENDEEDDNTALLDIELNDAQNQSRSQIIGAINSFKLWVRDSSNSIVTIEHEVEWNKTYRSYSDDVTFSPSFYSNYFLDSLRSGDSSFAQKLSNEFRLQFLNEFLSVGYRNEQYHYFQNYFIDENFNSDFVTASLNGNLFKQTLEINFEKGISGFHENEIDVNTKLKFNEWRGIKSTINIRQTRKQADFFLLNQFTNHNKFSNEFNTSNHSLFSVKAEVEKRHFAIDLGFRNLKNYIYYDSLVAPQQTNDAISVLYVKVKKEFKFLKHFHLFNRINFQQIQDNEIIPMPELFSYHSLFYENVLFQKALKLQLGVDFYYIGEYTGYAYSPSSTQFHLRNEEEALGNINQVDVFLNLGINKSGRIFVKMENILNNSFAEETARIQDYPIPGRVLKVGFSWRMIN